jgi:hypothetical protein
MSKAVPAANSESAGTGQTWFKIWEWAPTWSKTTGLVFASESQSSLCSAYIHFEILICLSDIWQFNFTIPKSTPSGQYLVRGEQIALHLAETYQGAQFYLGCAQINVRHFMTSFYVLPSHILVVARVGCQRRQWHPWPPCECSWSLYRLRTRNSDQYL